MEAFSCLLFAVSDQLCVVAIATQVRNTKLHLLRILIRLVAYVLIHSKDTGGALSYAVDKTSYTRGFLPDGVVAERAASLLSCRQHTKPHLAPMIC